MTSDPSSWNGILTNMILSLIHLINTLALLSTSYLLVLIIFLSLSLCSDDWLALIFKSLFKPFFGGAISLFSLYLISGDENLISRDLISHDLLC